MSSDKPIKRATKRPAYLDLPYKLSDNPPLPEPKKADGKADKGMAPRTRYGDWEREGRAWDF